MSSDGASNGGASASKLPDLPGQQEFAERNGQHHPIAEFLYQLTKMLTDDNSEIIEWSDGRIKVHFPERLEAEVLHKYFRHSKFASFQRQLNYFGFRKIAGKGKMSPCSYVNEAASSDIRSLLLIKRKTNGSAARKAAMQQQHATVNPELGNGLNGMGFSAIAPVAPTPGQVSVLNGQLTNAMALLTENALRAGLGQFQLPQVAPAATHQQTNVTSPPPLNLFALQQQQQLQQLAQQQLAQATQPQQLLLQQQQPVTRQEAPAPNALLQHQHQQPVAAPVPVAAAAPPPAVVTNSTPSLEQLQAQIKASLAGKQPLTAASLLGSGLNLASNPVVGSLQLGATPTPGPASNPASAALQALNAASSKPENEATAAVAVASQPSQNVFESAINLKTLLNEHTANQEATRGTNPPSGAPAPSGVHPVSSTALLHRLPSSNTIFPESAAAATSFSNLLGSSNRLSSLLSLNSFLGSREQSIADFAATNSMSAQLASGTNLNGIQQFSASDSNAFRNST